MSKRHRHAHPCPTATKTAWSTPELAEEALEAIRAEHDRAPIGEKIPVRAYRCECGAWHLTSARESYTEIATRLADAQRARRAAAPA